MIKVPLDDLWRDYKDNGDREARNGLLEHYLPIVKYVAGKIAYGLPPHVDQGDLVSYGTFGLIDALEKFDLSRGFKFETYAIPRIRGSILDELRSADWVPRSVRSKARAIDKATQKLGAELHRNPLPREIAMELDMTVEQYNTAIGQVSFASVVGLDESVKAQNIENITIGDAVIDHRQSIDVQLEAEDLRTLVAGGIRKMNDRERIVATLYYYEGLSLGEIGTVLGVTESRICQIHTKAITNLLQ